MLTNGKIVVCKYMIGFFTNLYSCQAYSWNKGGCCGCDRMVVGFTTTYAISAYHHWCCEFESRLGRGVHHYVIKFVSLTVRWFSPGPPVSSINKTDCHDLAWNIVESGIKHLKTKPN
jgi:hypothetical protein